MDALVIWLSVLVGTTVVCQCIFVARMWSWSVCRAELNVLWTDFSNSFLRIGWLSQAQKEALQSGLVTMHDIEMMAVDEEGTIIFLV